MTTSNQHMIWVDLETTDLEPSKGEILELGLTMTTPQLEIEKERSWILKFDKIDLGHVNDWCLKQHFLSGLLPLSLASNSSVGEVQDDALNTLRMWGVGKGEHPMCGASVHFDRSWLKADLPQLEAWFTYRNIDVSTVGGLARLWYPSAVDFKDRGLHRVTPDNQDAIARLRFYIEEGVITGPGVPLVLA
jgi:oligoribonuclease